MALAGMYSVFHEKSSLPMACQCRASFCFVEYTVMPHNDTIDVLVIDTVALSRNLEDILVSTTITSGAGVVTFNPAPLAGIVCEPMFLQVHVYSARIMNKCPLLLEVR